MTTPAAHLLRAVARALVPPSLRPSGLLRRTVQAYTGMRVHGGPFRGLRLSDRAVWGAYVPKLLGTYELEVRSCIEEAIAARPTAIVDIGAAEGFYALGLLMRLPQARLIAFDQLEDARALARRMATVNGVGDRLDVRETCDPDGLRAALRESGATLVVCDVEGYEFELLDPSRITELEGTDLLVEVHEAQRPGCRATLERRFCRSHVLEHIEQRPRVLADYPFRDAWTRFWPDAVIRWGLNEFRSTGNGWLWMRARRRTA